MKLRGGLTEAQQIDIIVNTQGLSRQKLASAYNVSLRTIGRILVEAKEDTICNQTADTVDDTVDDTPVEVETVEIAKYHFVLTLDNITVTKVTDDDNVISNVLSDDANFETIYDMILTSRGSQEVLADVFVMITPDAAITEMSLGMFTAYPREGRIEYNYGDSQSYNLGASLTGRILQAVKNKETGLDPLVKFAEKLINNPSRNAVNDLFDFMVAKDIHINKDGYIICFKRIRANYTDCHSGKFDNSIGAKPKMPRHEVDSDNKVTCSRGLHVCSESYLKHFYGAKVIKVLVDPADFVAVPKDYNDAKARVCAYEVIEDVTDTYLS